MIDVAHIGCGYWGPNLLRNLMQIEKCKVKIISDIDPGRLKYIQQLYPGTKVTPNCEEIFNDKSINAVVIATPACTHFELAYKAIKSGKHVLVEKPLAMKTSEAITLIDLAKSHKTTLMAGHTFVYNAAVRSLKEYLAELGEIYYIYGQRLNLGKIRQDVNVIWNLALHDISILFFLLEEQPLSVSAKGVSYIQKGIEDIAFLTISFENNIVAHLHVSWLDPNKVRRMTFVGSKKMIIYDDISDFKIQIYDKGIDKSNIKVSLGEFDDFGKFQLIQRAGDVFIPKIDFVEPLKSECKHFIDCILDGIQPHTDGYSGMQVINLLEAAQQSLEKNGREVEISQISI